MAKIEKLFIGFALVGLFTLAIISFGALLQQDNDVEDSILQNDFINTTFNDLTIKLGGSKDAMGEGLSAFENETATQGVLSLIFRSIPTTGKIIRGIITGVFGVLIVLPAQLLGVSTVVVGVIEAILLVLIVLGLWRLYKLGG